MTESGRKTRLTALGGLLALGSILSVFAGCLFGPLSIPADQVAEHLGTLFGFNAGQSLDAAMGLVVNDIRLPRACLAWLVGASLAAAGAVFQGILQNPLADPFTIGVSTGAAFGASLAIFLGVASLPIWLGMGVLPLAAMVGAVLALAAVISLGRVAGRLRRETVVLAGIVVATFLSALISLLKSLDEESVAGIVFWVMGSFQGRSWEHVAFAWPYMLFGGLAAVLWAREIDLLSMGDSQARLLGLDADRSRLKLLLAASLMTGAAVSVSGVIGFVGLVVPHLVRLVIGAEHRPLVCISALAGGVVLIWSDVAARTILSGGQELPVGVITALLGGPFFCLLLRRKGGKSL
ncbi:FecCD family ABC transporter permease [Desulfovibrio ferrophilus]|uniref:ABC transporter n=1 Tax=Desulfovibrio ferrophilus TaxID=241368 RepID=A0A2Z6AWW8_9BACT|nr:iron ABC transporter permease [Desulfovibrio ferrophilus]BBD07747.1 ABC transporter [Desulfovibrio ferrophilus]